MYMQQLYTQLYPVMHTLLIVLLIMALGMIDQAVISFSQYLQKCDVMFQVYRGLTGLICIVKLNSYREVVKSGGHALCPLTAGLYAYVCRCAQKSHKALCHDPFLQAAIVGDLHRVIEIVQNIKKYSCEHLIDLTTEEDGYNMLHFAVCYNRLEIVKFLIKNEASELSTHN